MSKLFGGIFGRAEKSAPSSTIMIDGEKYDLEYVRYCIEKDRTISALEAKLHESDDPKEIAQEALKTACLFYGGDWPVSWMSIWNWMFGHHSGGTTQGVRMQPPACLASSSLLSPCRTGLKHSTMALPCVFLIQKKSRAFIRKNTQYISDFW